MVLWLVGLSGSGKTVLGRYIYEKLRRGWKNTLFFDGDIFREIMGGDLGHTVSDRKKNADRITKFCKYLDSAGVNVVFAVLSLFHDSQEWNRKNIEHYYEVYIKCDKDVLIERDAKGIYKKALKGEIKNVVGIDIDFIPPIKPNKTIVNNGSLEDLYREGDGIIEAIKPLMAS